jgi:hypothetical protein
VTAPQTPLTGSVDALAESRARPHQWRGIVIWMSLLVATLALTSVAVSFSDVVGPSTLPWWPSQNLSLHVTGGMVIAPLTAAAVLWVARRPAAARMSWHNLLVLSYVASLTWSGALHTDIRTAAAPTDTPGSVTVTEWLKAYTGSQAGLAVTVTALSCLAVPLALVAVKSVCGPVAARLLSPVLVLGPWAAWTTLGMDGVAAAACAAVLAAGAVASERRIRGLRAFWGSTGAGALLGVAALLSYGAAWFAVSLLCLYFVRRRPWHILGSAASALGVLAFAAIFGTSWPAGLVETYEAAVGEIAAHPGQLWWLLLMPALVCTACGPAIVESLRRLGSGSAWPLMAGPLLALLLAPLSGANPERPEYSWVALCPWLVVAATASWRGAAGEQGRSVKAPLASAAAGACAAIVMMYSG